jgi:hypothetical protein
MSKVRTAEETKAIQVVAAIATAVRDLKSVPAGHLYASVMGHMSLAEFEKVVGYIVETGLVRRDGSHLLTWVG